MSRKLFAQHFFGYLLEPFSLPVCWAINAEAAKDLFGAGSWSSRVIHILWLVLFWSCNAAMLLQSVHSSKLVVAQLVVVDVLFLVRCFLISVKRAIRIGEECADRQQRYETGVTSWSMPSLAALEKEFSRSLIRSHSRRDGKDTLQLSDQHRATVLARIARSPLVDQNTDPGAMTLKAMFLLLQGDVLEQTKCLSTETDTLEGDWTTPWMRQQLVHGVLFSLLLCCTELVVASYYSSWHGSVSAWIVSGTSKLLLLTLGLLLYAHLAAGTLEYRKRALLLEAGLELIQDRREVSLKGCSRRVAPLVALHSVENIMCWYTLVNGLRECDRQKHVQIQHMYGSGFSLLLVCSLVILIQEIGFSANLLTAQRAARTYINALCVLVLTVVLFQLLRTVSWGFQANRVTRKMRQALMGQHMDIQQFCTNSSAAPAQGDRESRDSGTASNLQRVALGNRCELELLEVLQSKLQVDDMSNPVKLLGLRADDDLIRIIWTVVASIAAILSYLVGFK